ncbi:hypothetical protein GKA74_15460 [Vibrio parahaemolyticus]|nr:hypothetical protein [Vibrio parahaemolyticus]EGQ8198810.1 hypothetical protein [Vibrio parahaemolyticus]EGQ8484547.1 hypothetical protein [Vibrio parahaemolyticus]EGQ8549061.1 hypothetical protein [Vibrio parahaemolyticus]EGQ8679772.1 hypothetical protein [Vibrio parahaemolyticus]
MLHIYPSKKNLSSEVNTNKNLRHDEETSQMSFRKCSLILISYAEHTKKPVSKTDWLSSNQKVI